MALYGYELAPTIEQSLGLQRTEGGLRRRSRTCRRRPGTAIRPRRSFDRSGYNPEKAASFFATY